MRKRKLPLRKIVIIGAGGIAKLVLDIIDTCNKVQEEYEVLGYIVESQYGAPGTVIYGRQVLGDFDWLAKHASEVDAVCAVGPSELRLKLVKQAEKVGARFCNIINPLAYLSPSINMGVGNIIGAFVAFGPEVRLGNHVFVNHSSAIGEEVNLGDFVTVSPLTNIARSCNLARGSFVSVGVTIIDRIDIGEWSMIGGGTTIIRDVPANATVVGVPGKIIKTREAGWHLNA
jgi:sugar O-acyltransferase (sialic acid O-acetyltransferase NeuD family)